MFEATAISIWPPVERVADRRQAAARLMRDGWVLGPRLETDSWRRAVRKQAARYRVATGITPTGEAWAARIDLSTAEERRLFTPWYRMGVRVHSFFTRYPPPPP
jgi:hypothetical protein